MNIKQEFSSIKGFSLVEILIALAISITTITGATAFSINLMRRSQENFVQVAIQQLQVTIIEELRFIQQNSEHEQTLIQGGQNLTPSSNHQAICNQVAGNYEVTLPDFSSSKSYNLALQLHTSAPYNIPYNSLPQPRSADGSHALVFKQISSVQSNSTQSYLRYGPLQKSDIAVSIDKDFYDEYVRFQITILYRMYNKTYYTKPEVITMIKSKIC